MMSNFNYLYLFNHLSEEILRKDTKLQYQEQAQMKFLQAHDHYLLHLQSIINIKVLKKLENWYKFVLPL